MVANRTHVSHGFYRIIAGQRGAGARANAYLGLGKLKTCEAPTVEEAIRCMMAVLDERMATLRLGRVNGVPTRKEYAEAIAAVELDSQQRMIRLLDLHARLPEARASTDDLAQLYGAAEPDLVASYIRFASKVASVLHFAPHAGNVDSSLAPLLTLAEVIGGADGRIHLQLYREVNDAIKDITTGAAERN